MIDNFLGDYDWIDLCVGLVVTTAYFALGVPRWIDSLYRNKPYFRRKTR